MWTNITCVNNVFVTMISDVRFTSQTTTSTADTTMSQYSDVNTYHSSLSGTSQHACYKNSLVTIGFGKNGKVCFYIYITYSVLYCHKSCIHATA